MLSPRALAAALVELAEYRRIYVTDIAHALQVTERWGEDCAIAAADAHWTVQVGKASRLAGDPGAQADRSENDAVR